MLSKTQMVVIWKISRNFVAACAIGQVYGLIVEISNKLDMIAYLYPSKELSKFTTHPGFRYGGEAEYQVST